MVDQDQMLSSTGQVFTLKGMRAFHRLSEDIDVLMESIDIHHGGAQATEEGQGRVIHLGCDVGLLQCLA